MEIFFSIAFTTGLASSFHCIGMCGPIALALPTGTLTNTKSIFAKTLYNLGRILSYSLLGLIFGFFGRQVFVAGFQQNLSILIGLFLIISLFIKNIIKLNVFSKITFFVSASIKKLMPIQSLISFLLLGILNGLLPCGMVYIALAGASATSSLISGALFMVFFGLGTAPLMFSISLIPNFVSINYRQKINRFLPIYTLFLAAFFVVRGMGLGIPYLSPVFEKNISGKLITVCHSNKNLK